jgi:SecD/SecF fusion protein
MEKPKRWQLYLILAVIVLTIYNILPTIFYYSHPLRKPINAEKAHEVSLSIVDRVNSMEEDSKAWLYSFSKLLHVKPVSIEIQEDPKKIEVTFANSKDADVFKQFLPRAGALIPFVPAQLELDAFAEKNSTKVTVLRQIGIHPNPEQVNQLFRFTSKYNEDGSIAKFYRDLVYDRAAQLALALGGESKTAQQLAAIGQGSMDSREDDLIVTLSKEMIEMERALGKDHPVFKRYLAFFAQTQNGKADDLVQKFLVRAETFKTRINAQVENLLELKKGLKEKGQFLDTQQQQQLSLWQNQRSTVETANAIIRSHSAALKKAKQPLSFETVQQLLAQVPSNEGVQTLSLEGRNPYVEALLIDWNGDRIIAKFYPDVVEIRQLTEATESEAILKERLQQYVINEMARASSISDEALLPFENTYAVSLNQLTNPTGFLAFDLGYLAKMQSKEIAEQIRSSWTPQHIDLANNQYPVYEYEMYNKLKPEDQKLGLVVYAPASSDQIPIPGFRAGSIYVIAKGMDLLIQKYQRMPNAPESQTLAKDINQLASLLRQSGFIGYPGAEYGIPAEFAKDYIFELDDYYSNLIKASREDFRVYGSKRYAVMDFTDVEQRILTWNHIEDQIQEDLLKWQEAYNAAQIDLNPTSRYQVPKPTKNPYWENFKLSFFKFFRGDDRKILKWGLDLSGGKTVRIGLKDQNGKDVTEPDDLKQAVNELYARINKMGVSERTIVIEGKNIILDFPGSQNLSASELVKASAMYFHIVNEKFSSSTTPLREATQQFLQNVWNEAVVTNRKDIDSINEIAWQHLGAETNNKETRPRSEYAKVLYENGLRLANPKESAVSPAFDDTISAIGLMDQENISEWDGQTHPLLIIFKNFALEGSSLNNIQVGYDPSKGNILSFGVKRSYEGSDKTRGSPRDDFYNWTSQFAEDQIVGTPKESYTQGNGWRMAVILNGTVISKPSLNATLSDSAMISGRFSQREINQLAADLKAGSLSFTPRILSEHNVSPELGYEERIKGVVAAVTALILVVSLMVGYYRFAGVVASAAVLFNILIMWGILQNIGAALTLPGIAGIVLTIGMAVDANVLVFERFREEFKQSGRIGSAIQAGYRKAFSAIFDSNITTIIAALILIQFDSGPIKAFAVMLIIGIVSSMFTALFMTRYFFAKWVQNPKNKTLNMSQFIGSTHFNFLGQAKKAITISAAVILVGTYFFLAQLPTMLGMDFTGGYTLVAEFVEQPGKTNYRLEAMDALLSSGATSNDVQIRELSRPNQLRFQLGMGMEEKGHPFYSMPAEVEGRFQYDYQHNPRISWIVKALENKGLKIQPSQLDHLNSDWSVTSGQFSSAMRYNAAVGLAIALLCILIYITLRFEFKYAVGAVVGLVHDVVITLGILALFQRLGLPVQIDLQVVGAVMTIIGYSLNDTIIVFDRIREDLKIFRKMKFYDLCNHALNVTLSRTIMTSGTTLLVLLALLFLGGKSIFTFSLVMTIGVIVGTLSSLYVATPVMVYFHNKEEEKQEALHPSKA